MKDNLILSGAHDLGYKDLRAFLLSLRATGSRAKVHLVLAGVDRPNLEKIESLDVTTEPFRYLHFRRRRPLMLLWPLWKRMLAVRDLSGKCRLASKVLFFVGMRHALFLDYLLRHRHEYENVLLVDCRDVYFQADPFAERLEPGVHCYLEAATQVIGRCPFNSGMIRAAFGPGMVTELAEKPVSCAGSVLGDMASIIAYLEAMVLTLCQARKLTQINDQGVHNYLIHHGLIPSLHLHDNYSHLVFTAGCEHHIPMNDRNEVVRRDGKPYALLHQYDRNREVEAKLLGKLDLQEQDEARKRSVCLSR